jgi:hypothetical protein
VQAVRRGEACAEAGVIGGELLEGGGEHQVREVDGGEGEKRWNQVFIKSRLEIGNAVENMAVTMSFVNDDDLVLEVDAERLSSG